MHRLYFLLSGSVQHWLLCVRGANFMLAAVDLQGGLAGGHDRAVDIVIGRALSGGLHRRLGPALPRQR